MTLVFPLTFLSSAFVPISTMPGELRVSVAQSADDPCGRRGPQAGAR